ncbi:hypothetical protein ACWC9U_30655 [Streptomyces sp. 900116325]
MPFFLLDAVGEHGLVDVRGYGGEYQALKLDRLQGLDFPLDRPGRVQPVSVSEPWPAWVSGLAGGCGQLVLAHLVVGEHDALDVAPAVRARHPVPLDVRA